MVKKQIIELLNLLGFRSEGKKKKGKNAVMGQKCTFSTLISVEKVKRIYRMRVEKWTNFRIY